MRTQQAPPAADRAADAAPPPAAAEATIKRLTAELADAKKTMNTYKVATKVYRKEKDQLQAQLDRPNRWWQSCRLASLGRMGRTQGSHRTHSKMRSSVN